MAAAVEAKGMALGESAIEIVAQRLDTGELAKNLAEASLRGSMLGAMDADFEEEEDATIEPSKFGALRLKRPFTVKPFDAAIKDFEERKVVTRDVFDKMTDDAKRRAFTVAGLTSEKVINEVKNELRESLALGEDIRKFKKRLRENMATKGWLKPGPKKEAPTVPGRPWHLETIYRNNVQASYARGRQGQMLQPHVVSKLPFWEIVTANDERVRETHEAAHGKILRADDPFWQSVGTPPWGHNCRCRVVARTPKQAAKRAGDGGINAGDQIEGLPDKNFAGQRIEVAPELPIDLFAEEPTARASPIPPPEPAPPDPPPTPRDAADIMRDARAKDVRRLGSGESGANESAEVVFVDDDGTEVRAIFKPAAGETPLRPGIDAGSYYRREAAVSEVDALMGGDRVVPPTVVREVEGKVGSVQQWNTGAKSIVDLGAEELEQLQVAERVAGNASVRRTFLLDVTMQNTDRHAGNALWSVVEKGAARTLKATAIDNGLTLPFRSSNIAIRMPGPGMSSEATMRRLVSFDKTSVKQLKKLTPTKLAALFEKNGIERRAARAAMIRVEAIKANPAVIEEIFVNEEPLLQRGLSPSADRVHRFWAFSHEAPLEILSDAKIKKVEKALQKAYGS